MGNPIITEIAAGANYSVADSARVHVTLALSPGLGEADFDITFPTVATPTVSLQRPPTVALAITLPAPVEQSSSAIPDRIVHWSTADVGPTRTLHIRVEDTTLTAFGETWIIKVAGLPAAISAGAVTVSNATINLVEADPVVEVLTPTLNRRENQSAALQARTRRNTVPLPTAIGCAGMTLDWTQDSGDTIAAAPGAPTNTPTVFPDGTPGCQREETVNVPGLTAPATLHYTFSATIGEFSNTGTAVINASPRVRHSILVIDRSGSMSGAKWDNAAKGAHVWLDLLDAFRQGVSADDRVGILVFEDQGCSFRVAGSPDSAVEIVFPTPGTMGSLPTPPNPSSLTLGSPGSCTPIGDALIQALNRMTGLPGDDSNLYGVLLLTDGYENAGTVRVDKEAPPPLIPGVEIFETIRSINDGTNDRTIFHFSGSNRNIQFYAVGVGPLGGVQEDVLDDLAYGDVSAAPGYYRLVSNIRDLLPSFAEMLSHYIGASTQAVAAAPPSGNADPGGPAAGTAAYFLVPAGEAKLVVVLVWNSSSDQMDLRWRPQGPGAFQTVPGGALTVEARASHGVAIVDLSGVSTAATEWRVQYKPGGGAVGAIDPGNVLAARDLRVRAEILFDQGSYRTNQPMKIEARLQAGGQPITDARVVVELAKPGESLGTFLATNSSQIRFTTSSGPQGGVFTTFATGDSTSHPVLDPPHPKLALLQQLLRQKDLDALPIVNIPSIFIDGTNELFDDGIHGDGAAKDGTYANTFANTDKEGSYTFRFTSFGRTPDGSEFADTITMSRWVGVNVDPAFSDIVVNYGLPMHDDRFQAAQIFVTPKDRGGQYLGPFRGSAIKFTTTAGAFQGDMVTHPDGRYSRVLVYKRGELPIITISVQDKKFTPIVVAPGCLGQLVLLLRSLLQWILRLIARAP